MSTPKGGRDQLKKGSFEMGKESEPNASIEKKWLQITSLTWRCMHPPLPPPPAPLNDTHIHILFTYIISLPQKLKLLSNLSVYLYLMCRLLKFYNFRVSLSYFYLIRFVCSSSSITPDPNRMGGWEGNFRG